MQPLLCLCLGERSQEDPDFLTSHRCQVPLRVYPVPHCFPSNWSFPGNFRKRKVSPFYKRGHQVPEKEAFSLPSQVSQGDEPSVGTPSPVPVSSFSPKLPRTRAKRVPQLQARQQQQTPGPTDLSGAQALSVRAKGHSSLSERGALTPLGSAPGCSSALLPDLVAKACCGNACPSAE